jgi:hypothetical protein
MGIERKLKVGELFKFPGPFSGSGQGVVSLGCCPLQVGKGVRPPLLSAVGGASLPGQAAVVGKASLTLPTKRSFTKGENAEKGHRNFFWLPWVLDAVNQVNQQGRDVMSGPFSGCYLIRYKEAGGDWRVAHVSMPGGAKAWNALAAQPGFSIQCGFKPFLGRRLGDGANDFTCGVITDDGRCFRVYASETNLTSYRLIKQVHMMDSLAPDTLYVLPVA